MRITFVISSLRGGGAERVVSHMANYWASLGWPTTILTVSHGDEPPYFHLHSRVNHVDMRFSRVANHPVPNARALQALKQVFDECSAPERRIFLTELNLVVCLRHAIVDTRPDAVISFINLTNIRVLLATQGLSIPVIVSERNDPYRDLIGEGMSRLRRRLYPRATYLVAQTEEAAGYFDAVSPERRTAIPNPVLPAATDGNGRNSGNSGRTLLGMGRLSEEKGFLYLLRAFGRVAEKHPDWSLQIWGEGPQRPHLERLAGRLNLAERIRLPGFTRQPFDALKRADLFALSSLFEGFPNVLCEAMAHGLPVVSFNCSSGIREIIRNGVDGVIVPAADMEALALALDQLMESEQERNRLASKAGEIAERFSIEKTMTMWDQLLPRVGLNGVS
jgi:GalNAc-alpha-(1->4)-GalNAc-alpha-(1->3)-diNAcBac-PP-undecaprenol alpha-1,4-N-acetyl-D-galactosaminyltransferase